MAKPRFPAGLWLSFQPGARGGNSWLTPEKWADPAWPGAGDPVRSLAAREHRHLFTGSSTKTRCLSKETLKEDTRKGNSALCFSSSKRRHFSHLTSLKTGVCLTVAVGQGPRREFSSQASLQYGFLWLGKQSWRQYRSILLRLQEPDGCGYRASRRVQQHSSCGSGKWGALHDGEEVGGPAPGAYQSTYGFLEETSFRMVSLWQRG